MAVKIFGNAVPDRHRRVEERAVKEGGRAITSWPSHILMGRNTPDKVSISKGRIVSEMIALERKKHVRPGTSVDPQRPRAGRYRGQSGHHMPPKPAKSPRHVV